MSSVSAGSGPGGVVKHPTADGWRILPGISVAALRELAEAAGFDWNDEDLGAADVRAADEILLCSTSVCVLPVTSVDGQPVGDGKPGTVYRRLLDDWSKLVGVDIRQQALAHGS